MTEFRMPSLGADMEKGRLVVWHVKAGEHVTRGQVIADVETDKGIIEVEIWHEGDIEQLLVIPGQEIPVGTVMAIVRETTAVDLNLPNLPMGFSEDKPVTLAPVTSVPVMPKSLEHPESSPKAQRLRRLRISPLARRLAQEKGIALEEAEGSGEGGAIVRADIERLIASQGGSGPSMRRGIAMVMSRSKKEIPHYYLQTDVLMTNALHWLTQTNETRDVNDRLLPLVLILRAIVHGISVVPELNGYYINNELSIQRTINLGIAIAIRGGGLVAPALLGVENQNIDSLGRNLMDLIRRSRAGKLRSSEMERSTLTVTNLGDHGVDSVFGIIYPPQVALVGIGRIRERPWAEHGMLGVMPVLTLTLSADHRASDGHRGGQFLNAIAAALQAPENL